MLWPSTVTVSPAGVASAATQGSAVATAHATPKPITNPCTLRAFAFMTRTPCLVRRHFAAATGTVHARNGAAECGESAEVGKLYGRLWRGFGAAGGAPPP